MWDESRIEEASRRPFEVLLVEDNPGDVRLITEALRMGHARKEIRVVQDGVQALEYLAAAEHLPDLLVLDLALPRKNGHEVLAEVRGNRSFDVVPIVVFSSSSSHDDIEAAYRNKANCYVTKPHDLDRFLEVVQRIETFWLDTARLATAAV